MKTLHLSLVDHDVRDGAAALLRIKPTTLVSKMKRLGVRRDNG